MKKTALFSLLLVLLTGLTACEQMTKEDIVQDDDELSKMLNPTTVEVQQDVTIEDDQTTEEDQATENQEDSAQKKTLDNQGITYSFDEFTLQYPENWIVAEDKGVVDTESDIGQTSFVSDGSDDPDIMLSFIKNMPDHGMGLGYQDVDVYEVQNQNGEAMPIRTEKISDEFIAENPDAFDAPNHNFRRLYSSYQGYFIVAVFDVSITSEAENQIVEVLKSISTTN